MVYLRFSKIIIIIFFAGTLEYFTIMMLDSILILLKTCSWYFSTCFPQLELRCTNVLLTYNYESEHSLTSMPKIILHLDLLLEVRPHFKLTFRLNCVSHNNFVQGFGHMFLSLIPFFSVPYVALVISLNCFIQATSTILFTFSRFSFIFIQYD